jgi:polyhydroxybutyrate depolymerase
MTGQQEVGLTRMNAVADREKFVVVYPDAINKSWDMSGANDYNFILAIVDSMESRYKIDRDRVYASGFSQGGFFSFQLGCRYADVFAAIAPVSGLLNSPQCSPKRPVPAHFTYGTNEGFDINTFVESGEKWVELNECKGTPVVAKPYPATNSNSVVTRTTYTGCKENAEVVIQVVEGGTHEWPMSTNTKVNNSEEIWAFFKKYSLETSTALSQPFARTTPTMAQAHFSQGVIRLKGLEGPSRVKIMDIQGRIVSSLMVSGGQAQFDFRGESKGIYHIAVESQGRTQMLRGIVP